MALLLVGFLVTSGAVSPGRAVVVRPSAPSKFVPAPAGKFYGDAVWSSALGRLVVSVAPVSAGLVGRLASVRLDGSDLQPLPFSGDPACSRQNLGGPEPVPDGRIAYSDLCTKPPDHACLSGLGGCVPIFLRAYDPKTGTSSPFRPYQVFGGCLSIAPRTGRALYGQSNGLSGRLLWLRTRSAIPIRLPLSDVGCAAWSPDEKRIVIDGKPSSAGPDSPTRTDIPYVLYLLDGNARVVRRLPVAINDKAIPSWSPDGHWLAYRTDGKYPLTRVWLLNMQAPSAKPRMLIERPSLGRIAWLPDSKHLVVTGSIPSPGRRVPYGFFVVPTT